MGCKNSREKGQGGKYNKQDLEENRRTSNLQFQDMGKYKDEGKIKMKLCMSGSVSVGKSLFYYTFTKKRSLYDGNRVSNIGDFSNRLIQHDNKLMSVTVWDTAGQETHFSITKNFFRAADGVFVMFDLTRRKTWEELKDFWMVKIEEYVDERTKIVVLGNKKDLVGRREVEEEEVRDYCEDNGYFYFEISALKNDGVEEAGMQMVNMIHYSMND